MYNPKVLFHHTDYFCSNPNVKILEAFCRGSQRDANFQTGLQKYIVLHSMSQTSNQRRKLKMRKEAEILSNCLLNRKSSILEDLCAVLLNSICPSPDSQNKCDIREGRIYELHDMALFLVLHQSRHNVNKMCRVLIYSV